MPLFRRGRRNVLLIKLPAGAIPVLQDVFREVADALATPTGEVGDRLFPRAYLDPTEEEAEEVWQSVVRDDLARARIDAITELLADLDGARPLKDGNVEITLDEAAETRWLTVLNDARLTLGTKLGIQDEEELDIPPDDPRAPVADCYLFLSVLLSDLAEAVLDALPETGTDDP